MNKGWRSKLNIKRIIEQQVIMKNIDFIMRN